jgi:hypothetical protein
MMALDGWVARQFVSFKHTLKVGLCVVMERIFYHTVAGQQELVPVPSASVVQQFLSCSFQRFKAVAHKCTAWSNQQFVDSYHGSRRARYQKAADQLELGWTWSDVNEWAVYKTFIKHEKIPLPDVPKRIVPRCIQPRHPCYNVLLGRYIKACELHLFHAFQRMFKCSTPVIGKGVDVEQLAGIIKAKWDRFIDPVAIGLDLSRFDQHISVPLLRYEHQFYDFVYSHDSELARLLRYQLKNHGVLLCDDGKVKYTCLGGRGSGDMNTSLGNSLIMVCCIYAYCEYYHISVDNYDVIINGDDSLIFTDVAHRHQFNQLVSWFKQFELILKVEPDVTVLEQVSFCQMQPVLTAEGYRMVRSYPLCVQKDCHMTLSMRSPGALRTYLASLGVAGEAMCAGVPVLQSFYECLHSFGTPGSEDRFGGFAWNQWKRLLPRHVEITDDARVSFWRAFGVLPDHQIAVEQSYAQCYLLDEQCDDPTTYRPEVMLDPGRGSCY